MEHNVRITELANVRTSTFVPLPGGQELGAELWSPPEAVGMVVFVHGSGSSRFSPRNQHVAMSLNERGLATLLLDLLTPDEATVDERTAQYRFDIPRLAARVIGAVDALEQGRVVGARGRLPIGLFGASTGAAAALLAASRRRELVRTVVSRGGRPDLAGADLKNVTAPTLLIVGGADRDVITLNREAARQMRCTVEVRIVPGATHLFAESGALESVEQLAGDWFLEHLNHRHVQRFQIP